MVAVAMVLPEWYSAVVDYDSRGPTRSVEDYVAAILQAVTGVINRAIAQGQSLEELQDALMQDDQVLSQEYRLWLSQVVVAEWEARSLVPMPVMTLEKKANHKTSKTSHSNHLESCVGVLPQSA